MRTVLTARFWLALALVVSGVVLRVIPHPWNFAPIGAIALFGGARFDRRWLAISVPLAAMLIGDAILGFHALMPVVYAAYALIVVVGMLLRRRESLPAIAGCSLLSSTIFFMVTNFGVWAIGAAYAKNAAGLMACYVAAIPFFGSTLASDALFTAIFFGIYAVAERRLPLFARS